MILHISMGWSLWAWWNIQVSLKFFTLKRGFTEAFSEEILASVASSMTSEPSNWNNHSFISFIFSKDFLETVRQAKELLLLTNFALQNDWLNIKILKCLSHQFFCCGTLANLEISATRIHISFAHKPCWSFTVGSKMLHWVGSTGWAVITSFSVSAYGFGQHVLVLAGVRVSA